MNLPVLKYIDIVIGFALVMILLGTIVTVVNQILANFASSREKHLSEWLQKLLVQVDSANLAGQACAISDAVLRHPMIARLTLWRRLFSWLPASWRKPLRGTVVKREELIGILLQFAEGDQPFSANLRTVFGVSVADVKSIRQAIAAKRMQLEAGPGPGAAHLRESQAIANGISAAAGDAAWKVSVEAAIGKIGIWFDHAMTRSTQEYASEAKISTAVVALAVVLFTQVDSLDLLHKLSADDQLRASLVQLAQTQAQQQPAAGAAPPTQADAQAALAELQQPNLGILPQFYQASTSPAAALPAQQLQFVAGSKAYPIDLGASGGFWLLGQKIDGLGAGVAANVTQSGSLYSLDVRSRVPGVSKIELRTVPAAANLLGAPASYLYFGHLIDVWPGLLLSWMLLSLGTPFWYDLLKNMLQLRPAVANQEEQERTQRQAHQ